MFNVLEPYMRYNNSCVCKKTSMPPKLNFYNVGRSSCWPCSYNLWSLAGLVAQCCGSYAQFFSLNNPSRFYNYLFALNEKNVSSLSFVISGCWYD